MTPDRPDTTDDDSSGASQFDYQIARLAVGGYDDAQQIRKASMNRVRDIVRKRNEDIAFDEVEAEKPPEERDFSAQYADDNLPELIEDLHADGTFSGHEYEYVTEVLEIATDAQALENRFSEVMEIVQGEPIYTQWLQHVYGVSTTLTARLLHAFGYNENRQKVSQLWAYAGLDPTQTRQQGEKMGYDPEHRKLAWLVADRIIMQGANSKYKSKFYDTYKEKQEYRIEHSECQYCGERTIDHGREEPCEPMADSTAEEIAAHRSRITDLQAEIERLSDDDGERGELASEIQAHREAISRLEEGTLGLEDFRLPETVPDEATPPWNQGHADARARRYLSKKFLKHFWAISRDIKGLPVPPEWIIAHGEHDAEPNTWENPFYAKQELGDTGRIHEPTDVEEIEGEGVES